MAATGFAVARELPVPQSSDKIPSFEIPGSAPVHVQRERFVSSAWRKALEKVRPEVVPEPLRSERFVRELIGRHERGLCNYGAHQRLAMNRRSIRNNLGTVASSFELGYDWRAFVTTDLPSNRTVVRLYRHYLDKGDMRCWLNGQMVLPCVLAMEIDLRGKLLDHAYGYRGHICNHVAADASRDEFEAYEEEDRRERIVSSFYTDGTRRAGGAKRWIWIRTALEDERPNQTTITVHDLAVA